MDFFVPLSLSFLPFPGLSGSRAQQIPPFPHRPALPHPPSCPVGPAHSGVWTARTRFRAARTRRSSTYTRAAGPDLSFCSCIEKIVSCDVWICDLMICDCLEVEEGWR